MPLFSPKVRTGQGSTRLSKEEFQRRWKERFADPAFELERDKIDRLAEIAWEAYDDHRKSPRSRKAGPQFADPEYELSLEWLEARERILVAQKQFEDSAAPSRILLISGSPRTDETCPSEMSKTFRIATLAARGHRKRIRVHGGLPRPEQSRFRVRPRHLSLQSLRLHCDAALPLALLLLPKPLPRPDPRLDERALSPLGRGPRGHDRHARPLVSGHQPAQAHDGPPRLRRWRQPRSDHHPRQNAEEAKAIELKGWDYPKHLKGRIFSVIAHGDAVGAERVCAALSDWFQDMELVPAGDMALLDRYIGYYEPYATSHEALDQDEAFQQEVRNAARTLLEAVTLMRQGRREPGTGLEMPRKK